MFVVNIRELGSGLYRIIYILSKPQCYTVTTVLSDITHYLPISIAGECVSECVIRYKTLTDSNHTQPLNCNTSKINATKV